MSYSLWVVSGRFLLVVGRFRSFFACCGLFHVVLGRFLLVVGHFRPFQVVPRFSKYPKEQAFGVLKRNSYTTVCLKFLCDAKLITSLLIF